MLRITIAITIIFVGFSLRALLSHNIDYWVLQEYLNTVLIIFGLVILYFPLLEKAENTFHRTFFWQRFFRFLKLTCFTIGIVACTVGVQYCGTIANTKLRSYYISKNPVVTTGNIVDRKRLTYYVKMHPYYQDFYIIRFSANGKIIEEGKKVEECPILFIERKLTIKYSEDHPSFFEITL